MKIFGAKNQKHYPVFLSLSLLLFSFGAVKTFGQDLSCSTTFRMYEATAPDRSIPVTGVVATAVAPEGKSQVSVLSEGMPHFRSLVENGYTFSFRKAGYATTKFEIGSDCPNEGAKPVNVWVPIWRGDSATTKEFKFAELFSAYKEGSPIGVMLSDIMDVQAKTPIPGVPLKVKGGILNGATTRMPTPVYPAEARAANAHGIVNIEIEADEQGNIVKALAVSGDPALRSAAEDAARRAKLSPRKINGTPVRISGILVYNFVP